MCLGPKQEPEMEVGGEVKRKILYLHVMCVIFFFFFKDLLQLYECRFSLCLGKEPPLSKGLCPCAAFQMSCIPEEAVTQRDVPQAGWRAAILCFSPGSALTQPDCGQISFSSFLTTSSVWKWFAYNGVRRRVQANCHSIGCLLPGLW